MPQFTIVNESTEDTVGTANDIPSAVQQAKEAAQHARAGDLVTVLESGGMAVRQFVLLADGTVAEQAIAGQVTPAASNGVKTLRGDNEVAPKPA